jgi:lipopolysaccharide transport system ATP-binding protein
MTTTAIHAAELTKTYRIPAAQEDRYPTIRGDIVSAAGGLWRRRASSSSQLVNALHEVSFDISVGEAVGLIGRNGAGKSTLLKVLSRVTRPSAGYADIFGTVGALLEVGTGFHPELTGRENVFLSGAILGLSRREIASRFDEIVAFAEVEPFVDTPVKRFSSGMYARLAFAVAAHLRPSILIVDEVLAVGDLAFQAKCLAHMKRLATDGTTVLFVSHNMLAISDFCSRAILLNNGRLESDGSTSSVVSQYRRTLSQVPVSSRESSQTLRQLSLRANGDDVGGSITVTSNSPLRLELEVDAREAASQTVLNVVMETADGRRALHLRSDVAGTVYDLRVGRNGVSVDIRDLALAAGDYWLWMRLTSLEHRAPLIWDTERIFVEILGENPLETIAWPRHSFGQPALVEDQQSADSPGGGQST